jgi:hypothetical protein
MGVLNFQWFNIVIVLLLVLVLVLNKKFININHYKWFSITEYVIT